MSVRWCFESYAREVEDRERGVQVLTPAYIYKHEIRSLILQIASSITEKYGSRRGE